MKMPLSTQKLLIGNSFPLPLIRREVHITLVTREELLRHVQDQFIASFWGHANTLPAVNAWLGLDLTPRVERPALTLSPEQLPMLDGHAYRECYVLSPDYRPGFRPAIGVEVPPNEILGWQLLHLQWK